MCVQICIVTGQQPLYVVLYIFFGDAFSGKQVCGLVVGNGGLDCRFIASNEVISVDVDAGGKQTALPDNSLIGIVNLDIFPSEVRRIPVQEGKVPALNGIVLDAIPGNQIELHSIICHEVVVPAVHDFMGGIVKEVV